jgi:hypothetical protein
MKRSLLIGVLLCLPMLAGTSTGGGCVVYSTSHTLSLKEKLIVLYYVVTGQCD